jgi:putative oxidoreductase
MKNISTNDYSALVVRVVTGLVMLAHGVQKAFGWFGGFGFDGTMHFFTDTIGLPYVLGVLIIIGETAGALALMAGWLTRINAASFIIIMLGAIVTMSWQHGFYMNWYGVQTGEGYELHLLMIALSLSLLLTGGGKLSVDQVLRKRK